MQVHSWNGPLFKQSQYSYFNIKYQATSSVNTHFLQTVTVDGGVEGLQFLWFSQYWDNVQWSSSYNNFHHKVYVKQRSANACSFPSDCSPPIQQGAKKKKQHTCKNIFIQGLKMNQSHASLEQFEADKNALVSELMKIFLYHFNSNEAKTWLWFSNKWTNCGTKFLNLCMSCSS